ncbi:hypothetical protein PINS_up007754 [Pythium insidiosum]|nr:hypothetical protein PINS_up007754 [Pythium insidiosum]
MMTMIMMPRRWTAVLLTALVLALALAIATATSAPTQSQPLARPLRRLSQPCGSDVRGVLACPAGEFCHRLNAFHYVCRPRPYGMRGEPLHGVDIIPHSKGHASSTRFRDLVCTLPTCIMHCLETPSCVAVVFYSYDSVRHPGIEVKRCKIVLEGDDATETPRSVPEALSVYIDRDASCPAASRSVCGSESSTTSCCPRGEHCVIDGRARRCAPTSPQCTAPKFGTLPRSGKLVFHGGTSQSECCELCATTPGCMAYEHSARINGWCVLFPDFGPPQHTIMKMYASPINPLPPCETAKGGDCGDSVRGATCCPLDSYCQPLSPSKFQCVKRSRWCSKQVPQTELKATEEEPTVVQVTNASDCCDACKLSTECKAYTYIHDAPQGPLCRLFSKTTTERIYHATAVTGYLNSMFK